MVLKVLPPRFGKVIFYGCLKWPQCQGTHSCHQQDGKPMGKPADVATKRARQLAHRAFDRLWQEGRMKRRESYRWLREALNLSPEDAHISRLDKDQCEKLVALVVAHLKGGERAPGEKEDSRAVPDGGV